MGHDLRDDNLCENCGYIVEVAYCTRCGQKNIETRQSFAHLAAHFLEDLTHYDSSFWKTIKGLLFRPAKLTIEYLSGKTQTCVPPVKLYIFTSFIVFLLLALVPETEESATGQEHKVTAPAVSNPRLDVKEKLWDWNFTTEAENPLSYTSIRQMDSIEALKPKNLQLSTLEYKIAKRIVHLYEHNSKAELDLKYSEALTHNIPKAIFLYMPVFAFWLWLFHGKKKWYFFDHGIFTLHYFSFILITNSFWLIPGGFAYAAGQSMMTLLLIIMLLIWLWQIYYFYRAHRKMYKESLVVNFLKSTLLFVINLVCIVFTLILLSKISLYTLH
jgi:hypothetical protein